jgi:hypothetical protein
MTEVCDFQDAPEPFRRPSRRYLLALGFATLLGIGILVLKLHLGVRDDNALKLTPAQRAAIHKIKNDGGSAYEVAGPNGRFIGNMTIKGPVENVALLEHFPELAGVWISTADQCGSELAVVKRLPSLRGLVVGRITDFGMDQLAEMKTLRNLYIAGDYLTDKGLENLKGLTGLEQLSISARRLTDDCLINLADLPNLRELTINGKITGAGLAHLKKLPLRNLTVGDELTNEGLAAVGELVGLEQLTLSGGTITNKGLAHLRTLRELVVLDLSQTNLVPAGIGLDALRALPNLVELRVGQVPKASVPGLMEALPKVAITTDADELLGSPR